MNTQGKPRGAGAILLTLFLLGTTAGCGTTSPTSFYLLSPISGALITPQDSGAGRCITLGIGPVHLPEYLDRPQIVTQGGANQLQLADFHQWAEPLEKSFSRLLDENLSKLVCVAESIPYPWQGTVEVDYQVSLHVIRFHGLADGTVALVAQWTVLKGGQSDKPIARQRTTISEPVQGQGYDALAAAQSRVVQTLSQEIASAIARAVSGQ
jgi:hypothetical protein